MARLSARTPSRHTVLVVDDQQETLDSVQALLERQGHRVLTAISAGNALEILKQEDVHVIVLDYLMPHMNGGELVRVIRRFDPFVQIILHTGYAGDNPPLTMIEELEIQGYHDKTDDPDRLLIWVNVALRTYCLLEGMRDRERAHEELVANCSHEFRTPLNVISGYVEWLLDIGGLPDAVTAPLRSIGEATRGLTDMVTDFLQYARVNARVVQIADEWIDVRELGSELERFTTTLLDKKSIVFALDLTGAPARIRTDGVKLRIILRNLLTNAVKFTNEGTIIVRIREITDTVRFEVCDTGVGIEPDDREIIFEPFRQLDGSSTRKHGGVGLGLAVTKKLTRVLGGELLLESEPGSGSTFTCVLPAAVDVTALRAAGAA
jgi:signal transduction histidine kinase